VAPRVSVNLSGRQLLNPRLVTEVSEALFGSGLPPERLVLELTETALMTDLDASVSVLNELKALGVSIAVDDFGIGYSSLTYLKRFPLDVLKIDRSFVEDIDRTTQEAALAQAVVALGQTLNLMTVAEGVETQAHADRLLDLGCRTAQGYLFSRPVPPSELGAVIRSLENRDLIDLQGPA
ncbi:MAG: EAL domain-containing protein, partial [Actinomycetota bacterium]